MSDTEFPHKALYSASVSTTPLLNEAADRVAIRNLIDAWGHCADRRLAKRQSELFTDNGIVEIYQNGEPGTIEPVAIRNGRAEIEVAVGTLKQYTATTHFTGQSTVSIDGDHAIGETYCLAHHLWKKDGKRTLMVMSIRYYDTMVKVDNRWLFEKRQLIIDWVDTRPSEA